MNETVQLLITSLIAPVAIAGFTVLWKLIDKKNNLRIKELEKKISAKNSVVKKNVGTIYNVLSILLSRVKASRVYIIQPHPLKRAHYISVAYEVTDLGVMSIKEDLTEFPVVRIPVFFGEISTRDFLFYKTLDQMKGVRSRAFFTNLGSESLVIKHLSDDSNDYVGSIVLDYIDSCEISPDFLKQELQLAADKIQFILPPIED